MKFILLLAGFLVSLLGAQIALLLSLLLPWLMGPLLLMGTLRVLGVPLGSHQFFRNSGQWCIGTTLGLYFTPAILTLMQDMIWIVMAGIFFALFISILVSQLLVSFGKVDFTTAWFASVVGAASEMAHIAERHGGRVDLIASAHSLRLIMVVVAIPFAYYWLGINGQDADVWEVNRVIHPLGLFALCCLTLGSAFIFKFINVPNPWVLGPLFMTAGLTLSSVHLSAMPEILSHFGQLFIGWSLGCKFGPDFFRRAPWFLWITCLCTLLSLLLALLMSYVVHTIFAVPVPTLLLGFSPGGITEMTITAKVLNLGVPLVTMMHVSRLVFVLLTAEPLYLWQLKSRDANKVLDRH